MAIFKTGDMWSAYGRVDHFLVTTNSYIKKDGSLCMGTGIAKQAADRYREVPIEAGRLLRELLGFKPGENTDPYHLIRQVAPTCKVGIFQTKFHYRNPSSMALVAASADALARLAVIHAHRSFALNFPGIGHGGLPRDVVLSLLSSLPDNVEIWSYE